MTAAVATIPQAEPKASILAKVAQRYSVAPAKMLETLKATAFRGNVSDEQMVALLVVADQYKLNPFTKEIYAFPDKNNGIVPVVGVDGWSRIINEHPQFDGMDFEQDDDACTCTIYRKDRSHPVKVTEYMGECRRGTQPWSSHPRRMLRHKAMIQCARLAFGYAGIYDQDEAERIIERDITADSHVVNHAPASAPRTAAIKEKARAARAKVEDPPVDNSTGEIVMTYAEVRDRIEKAETLDAMADAADLIRYVPDDAHREELSQLYAERMGAVEGGAQ